MSDTVSTLPAPEATEAPGPDLAARLPELVALVRRFAPGDGLHETTIRPLQLLRASSPTQPLPTVYEPGLCLVVQGRKQAVLAGEMYRYDPLHCLLIAVTLPLVGQIVEATADAPYLCVRLNIDTQDLGALLLDTGAAAGGAVLAQMAPPQRGLNLARVSAPLLDAVLRLLRLLQTPADAPVLAPLALREIFYRVLTGELGPRLRALALAGNPSQRVARAIELLKRRYAEPLRIEDVADAVHMSESSLHHHFKQVTTMSPLQFQKHLRLHQARRLMLTEGLDAGAAGHRVGYESASQFSREYRRLFGAPPRAEITQLRGAAAA